MALVLEGDPEAADLFVLRFTKFIWAILVRHMQISFDDAEEIYQEVFVRLWEGDYRRLRTWSGRGDLASWLASLVRHVAADHFRKTDQPPSGEGGAGYQIEVIDPEPDPEVQVLIAESRLAVQKAFESLSESDQQIIQLRFHGGKTYREITVLLGITGSNVGVRLSRTLDRLRAVLRTEYSDLFRGEPDDTK
ncbi:RNA polymerase sigma factor [Gemmatimonadota bacterium]